MSATELDKAARPAALETASPAAATFAEPPASPASSVAAKLLAFYILLVVSRVLDVSTIWFLHIPMILLVVLIITTILRGDLRTLFSSNISRWFLAFTAWVVMCFPLSTWRGASVGSVESALQALAVYLIIVQLVRTESDWRTVVGAYAYAVLIASILSFFVGRLVEGRIALVNGSFADPNEFALILVIGLPFWWLKASRTGALGKPVYFALTVPIFVVFARTGSRSGLIALCCLFAIVLLFANLGQKLLIATLALVAVVAATAFLPDYLKVRFTTVFAPHTGERLDYETKQRLGGDIGSSEGRKMLLIQSIQMTFEHPIFGVGPGVFAAASWDERKRTSGQAGILLVSHNTYTQISSETGIPGFILFAATLFLCLKYTISDYRAAKRANADLAKNGFYFFASLSALSVGIFFLSVGYTHTLAVMFALSACLHNIAKRTLSGQPAEAVAPVIPSPWQKSQAPIQNPSVPVPGRFRSLRGSRTRMTR